MRNQRTLAELKRIGSEAFADAQQTVLTAREIMRDTKAHQEEVRGTIEQFNDAWVQGLLAHRKRT